MRSFYPPAVRGIEEGGKIIEECGCWGGVISGVSPH